MGHVMTWPSTRVRNTALWKLTDPDTIDVAGRRKIVRKRETRELVRKVRADSGRRVTR